MYSCTYPLYSVHASHKTHIAIDIATELQLIIQVNKSLADVIRGCNSAVGGAAMSDGGW